MPRMPRLKMPSTRSAKDHVLDGIVDLAGACAPEPVPSGFVFPTHGMTNGGPSMGLEGVLVEESGCLLVQGDSGRNYVIVWPDSMRLSVDGGEPVVVHGDAHVATVGDRVVVGGARSEDQVDGCVGEAFLAVDVTVQ